MPADHPDDEPQTQCMEINCTDPGSVEIIVEQDAFGVETEWYCPKHAAVIRAAQNDKWGECEWCHDIDKKLHRYKYPEEGLNATAFELCIQCYTKTLQCDLKYAYGEDDEDDDCEEE